MFVSQDRRLWKEGGIKQFYPVKNNPLESKNGKVINDMKTRKQLISEIEQYCEKNHLNISDVNPYIEKLYRLDKSALANMINRYEERKKQLAEDIKREIG